jgi:hypothetical protein
MVITQGDVFWARLSNLATGSEPENKRPVGEEGNSAAVGFRI